MKHYFITSIQYIRIKQIKKIPKLFSPSTQSFVHSSVLGTISSGAGEQKQNLQIEDELVVRSKHREQMEDGAKRKREVEAQVLDKVGEVISAINNAKHVDQVVCALHSLANLLFPLDAALISGLSLPIPPLLRFSFALLSII